MSRSNTLHYPASHPTPLDHFTCGEDFRLDHGSRSVNNDPLLHSGSYRSRRLDPKKNSQSQAFDLFCRDTRSSKTSERTPSVTVLPHHPSYCRGVSTRPGLGVDTDTTERTVFREGPTTSLKSTSLIGPRRTTRNIQFLPSPSRSQCHYGTLFSNWSVTSDPYVGRRSSNFTVPWPKRDLGSLPRVETTVELKVSPCR